MRVYGVMRVMRWHWTAHSFGVVQTVQVCSAGALMHTTRVSRYSRGNETPLTSLTVESSKSVLIIHSAVPLVIFGTIESLILIHMICVWLHATISYLSR